MLAVTRTVTLVATYREEIVLPCTDAGRRKPLDGLRAIAVILVMAGHSAPSVIPGGYIGVDVFFVLSGYLITQVLLASPSTGDGLGAWGAGLLRFWAARARRLIPPLALVVAVTAVLAARFAPPELWLVWRTDLWAALGYVANWRFIASAADYDTLAHGQSPLVHLWSLAVEEQFYLLWPLVLALPLLRRRLRLSLGLLLGISAVGLVALASASSSVERVIWGTDARAVQLLAGAFLAVCVGWVRKRAGKKPLVIAGMGGSLLLVALAALPSPATPAIASGLMLAAAASALGVIVCVEVQPEGWLGRALALRPLVALGVVSYSVYLWHLPVLWVWKQTTFGTDSAPLLGTVVVAVVSTVLAALTWILVEAPMRAVRLAGRSPMRSVTIIGACVVMLASSAAVVGFELRPQGVARALAAESGDFDCPEGSPVCRFLESGRPDDWECPKVVCVLFAPVGPPRATVVLGGDSVARSLAPGLVEEARKRGWRLVSAADGCSYIPDQRAVRNGEEPDPGTEMCEWSLSSLDGLSKSQQADAYVGLLGLSKGGIIVDGSIVPVKDPRHDEALAASAAKGLSTLVSVFPKVLIVLTPNETWPVECLDPARMATDYCESRLPVQPDIFAIAERNAVLSFVEQGGEVSVIDGNALLCPNPEELCTPGPPGDPWRYDGQHLTLTGSRLLAALVAADLEKEGL